MNDYKQQIINARDERETGDINKSLQMFLDIDQKQLDVTQLLNLLGELGLTYLHLNKIQEAKDTFEKYKDISEQENNTSHLAIALRHLSRTEFNKENPEKSIELAQKARQLAKDNNRQDIAWFDHGVVNALIFCNKDKEEIIKWYEIEAEDIYKISKDTKDETAKWVWMTGLLGDRSRLFKSKGDLYIALTIAEQFNLKIRQKQIEKMIEDFEN